MISSTVTALPVANAIHIGEPSIVMMHLSVSYISDTGTISQDRLLVACLPVVNSDNDTTRVVSSNVNFLNRITDATTLLEIANFVMRENAPEFTKLKLIRTGADEDDWFTIPIHECNLQTLTVGILKTQGILSNFICKDLYIELEFAKSSEMTSDE